MIYCISDIHGEVNRFTAMLDQIHFSTEDTLYIIGDVIDRALGGVDILKQIMAAFNMVLSWATTSRCAWIPWGLTMFWKP